MQECWNNCLKHKTTFIVLCCVVFYNVWGSTLTFVEDKDILNSKYITENRLYSRNVKSTSNCAVECQQQSACVMFGFSEDINSCMLYYDEVTNTSSYYLSTVKTSFYKAYCNDLPGYLFYRSISACLRHHTDRLTFEPARDSCWNEGATLHEVRSQKILDFYKPYATKRFWIGGYGDLQTNTWHWYTGNDVINNQTGSDLWITGSPKDEMTTTCLEIKTVNGVYGLNARNCTYVREFYCQI